MSGAKFLRADLHVHTHSDGDLSPAPDLAAYIAAAVASDLTVMAITDHNSTRFVRDAMDAAADSDLLVLPGIEISTRGGHLLAVFSPDQVDVLDAVGNSGNLKLKKLGDTDFRSERSMIDLIEEIGSKGGLAIPAHVDAADGIQEAMSAGELEDLLTSPHLAGLEFTQRESLSEWFTDEDTVQERAEAWKARQRVEELKLRGLARLMSSDAHSIEKVGLDRASRTLTRLRMDDPNFSAVRNAIQLNPKARCKAEALLPASYPWIESASFEGGFLDGVTIDFSPNLNCLIGGRGSGKSTALLAIRAALGASITDAENDPDQVDRMPDKTTVTFIDGTGARRTAVRDRDGVPYEQGTDSPIHLRLADLGQDESGHLARGYDDNPTPLLEFLDDFIVRHSYDEREERIVSALNENESEVQRTSGGTAQVAKLEESEKRLKGDLDAAKTSKVEVIAEWAIVLAAQGPYLDRIEAELSSATTFGSKPANIDVDAIAVEYGVPLEKLPAKDHMDGDSGLRSAMRSFDEKRIEIHEASVKDLEESAKEAKAVLDAWQAAQADLEKRRRERQVELEEAGLKVQAGAVADLAKRLDEVKRELVEQRLRIKQHNDACELRSELLDQLVSNRQDLFDMRKATMKRITTAANRSSDDLTISVYFDQGGIDDEWTAWLSRTFRMRSPRVQRFALKISPLEFAENLVNDRPKLLSILDEDGSPFITGESLKPITNWKTVFQIQTIRLEDRPKIEITTEGGLRRQFDQLSAGQQRSVFLSLLLCAERMQPMLLDQPEDHLDARYIAGSVVQHLEAAKERRQVIIATHSSNLTVLGDAELVVPLEAKGPHGEIRDVGAVDNPPTRDAVCELLEGGTLAYRRRGERYGFTFSSSP